MNNTAKCAHYTLWHQALWSGNSRHKMSHQIIKMNNKTQAIFFIHNAGSCLPLNYSLSRSNRIYDDVNHDSAFIIILWNNGPGTGLSKPILDNKCCMKLTHHTNVWPISDMFFWPIFMHLRAIIKSNMVQMYLLSWMNVKLPLNSTPIWSPNQKWYAVHLFRHAVHMNKTWTNAKYWYLVDLPRTIKRNTLQQHYIINFRWSDTNW